MNIIDEVEKLKDDKLKEEVKNQIVETFKMSDEELFFEEETRDIAGKKFIADRLVKKDDGYYTKSIPKEGPFCVKCWEEDGQLTPFKTICMVCKLRT
jgi:hypothetical protein